MSFNVYQPFLDYGLVPNPAVIFPTVIDNYEWGLFKDIAKDYYLCLREFRQKSINPQCGAQINFNRNSLSLLFFIRRLKLIRILREMEESPRTSCPCLSPSSVPDIWIWR